ncbi:hypothetical protein [Amycolatopsis sp. NPDC051903]|uniref:hypothetical protein n=1 Tax=Amycolatopsis sp. NPDC051903 TaxID=3363936 RepID=UPI0037A5D0B9
MTTTEPAPLIIPAAQSGNCVKCRRAPGRPRSPQTPGDSLIQSNELVVCDRCWFAAGGEDAVLAELGQHGELVLTLDGGAEFEALLAESAEYDRRHPIDRCLIEAGIRWETLRQIAVPARCDLVRWVLERVPPAHTRVAVVPGDWLDAVTERIRQQTGTEFKYNAKRRRWWRIANELCCCSEDPSRRQRRPLTWKSQEKLAELVGCSTRTVRRCVAWLQREGLLHEVLPGCQMPRQTVPDDETAAEQARREASMAAAVAAENAAIARAMAELDAVRDGLFGDAAAAAAEAALSPADLAALDAVDELDPGLVQLVPVYELRVPLSDAELAEEAAIIRAHTKLAATPGEAVATHHKAELVASVNAPIYRELFAIGHDGQLTRLAGPDAAEALTCGNVAGLLRPDENGHPPQVIKIDQVKSSYVQNVDNRPASPGSDKKRSKPSRNGPDSLAGGLTAPSEGDHPRSIQSEAVRAADWLLRSRLHPDLCIEVSRRWLTNVIRASGLLASWNTTFGAAQADVLGVEWNHQVPAAWNEIADLIHGVPDYPHLPRFIRNAPGWIKARFARADPHTPPSKAKIIRRIESTSPTLQERRQTTMEATRQADIAARRAAIEGCPLCDEYGFFAVDPTDPNAPLARCNHDPETSGW